MNHSSAQKKKMDKTKISKKTPKAKQDKKKKADNTHRTKEQTKPISMGGRTDHDALYIIYSGVLIDRLVYPKLPLWDMCRICTVQIQPRIHVLLQIMQMTRQHELDHTDHTDHTDQEYICPAWQI